MERKREVAPWTNLKRIGKGNYTVDISARVYKYNEAQRNAAINVLAQLMGYESYDFKMTSEPSYKTKPSYNPVWSYSITMPGSIPVVRNDMLTYNKIADMACTPVTDTTFGESNINAIVWGDGKFVAGGDGRKMAYSSDGVNWTAVKTYHSASKTSPLATANLSLWDIIETVAK